MTKKDICETLSLENFLHIAMGNQAIALPKLLEHCVVPRSCRRNLLCTMQLETIRNSHYVVPKEKRGCKNMCSQKKSMFLWPQKKEHGYYSASSFCHEEIWTALGRCVSR